MPREAGAVPAPIIEPKADLPVETTDTAVAQALAAPTPAATPVAEPAPVVPQVPVIAAPAPAEIAVTREAPPPIRDSAIRPSGINPAKPVPEQAAACANAAWTAFGEAQLALVRGFGEFAAEWAGMTQSGIAAGADAAVALLGAKTLADAVEIQAGLARRGVDAVIGGCAKFSEIGIKAAAEASRPMLSRFGDMAPRSA
jgi:hypothetical protein